MIEEQGKDQRCIPAIDKQYKILLATLAGWDVDAPCWSSSIIKSAPEPPYSVTNDGSLSKTDAANVTLYRDRMLGIVAEDRHPSKRLESSPKADAGLSSHSKYMFRVDSDTRSTGSEEQASPTHVTSNYQHGVRSRNTSDRMQGIEYYNVKEIPCRQ